MGLVMSDQIFMFEIHGSPQGNVVLVAQRRLLSVAVASAIQPVACERLALYLESDMETGVIETSLA